MLNNKPLTKKQQALAASHMWLLKIFIGRTSKVLRKRVRRDLNDRETAAVQDRCTLAFINSARAWRAGMGCTFSSFATNVQRLQENTKDFWKRVIEKGSKERLRFNFQSQGKSAAGELYEFQDECRQHKTAAPNQEVRVTSEPPALVAERISKLPDALKCIIEMRYGVNGKDQHTLEEAAEALDLTRFKVRQLEAKALKQLGAMRIA